MKIGHSSRPEGCEREETKSFLFQSGFNEQTHNGAKHLRSNDLGARGRCLLGENNKVKGNNTEQKIPAFALGGLRKSEKRTKLVTALEKFQDEVDYLSNHTLISIFVVLTI